jgi:hypothetical protein
MELFQQNFPVLGGLYNCHWGSFLQVNTPDSEKWNQILHSNRGHWVVAFKGFNLAGSNLVLDQVLCCCITAIAAVNNPISNSFIVLLKLRKLKKKSSKSV